MFTVTQMSNKRKPENALESDKSKLHKGTSGDNSQVKNVEYNGYGEG